MAGYSYYSDRNRRRPKKRLRAIGNHLLGDSAQPFAVTVSIICNAFNCLPSQVEDEDWRLIKEIMDYRLLLSARDQHNQDATKMDEAQVKIWQEMVEAVESDG